MTRQSHQKTQMSITCITLHGKRWFNSPTQVFGNTSSGKLGFFYMDFVFITFWLLIFPRPYHQEWNTLTSEHKHSRCSGLDIQTINYNIAYWFTAHWLRLTTAELVTGNPCPKAYNAVAMLSSVFLQGSTSCSASNNLPASHSSKCILCLDVSDYRQTLNPLVKFFSHG